MSAFYEFVFSSWVNEYHQTVFDTKDRHQMNK